MSENINENNIGEKIIGFGLVLFSFIGIYSSIYYLTKQKPKVYRIDVNNDGLKDVIIKYNNIEYDVYLQKKDKPKKYHYTDKKYDLEKLLKN